MISDILIGTLIPLWVIFVVTLANWLCLNHNLATGQRLETVYVSRVGYRCAFFGVCILILTFSLILTQVPA